MDRACLESSDLRIGFDARLLGSLGIGRYIGGLLPALADLLADRLVIVARPTDVALVHALTEGRGLIIPCDAPPYRFSEQSVLLVKLLRARLRLVHFPHYSLPIAYPGRFVATIHDLFSYQFPEIHSGLIPRRVNRLLLGNGIRRASAIITPSQATSTAILDRYPAARGKITVIAEAADVRFHPGRNPAGETAWLKYYGITRPYYLYLGQWKAYKNVPLLLEAFRRVQAQGQDCQLVLAGQDPRHPEVPAAAARLPSGSVVLPGRLPDDAVPDLYRAAAAVVVPSLAEGFGLPVLEAMACAVPVVCSEIPVLQEVAGTTAIFCDPADPDSFARGMLAALKLRSDPHWSEQVLARARGFSWRRAAEQTVEVYERALAD